MSIRTVVTSIIVALAAIGLVSMMITSPGQLLQQLMFAIVSVAIVIFLFRLFMRKRMGGNTEQRAYSKAVKQSKKKHHIPKTKYAPPRASSLSAKMTKKPIRRKNPSHLTLIEGNKGKRRTRASSE
ncbi:MULTISPECIES: SA1362 family protein [Bacillaceae]|uniref:YqhP n=1 Tax=Domibacillus aminovorans TaxID=29332 RepID=A0A177KSF0_9BACI|nr:MULTISPECIES: SA1362 family protein [Bacillaceae]OAH55996.1 hypothetical protein AWH48_04800 [Domibacillus aminovorans]